MEGADVVVRVSGVEDGSISRPGEASGEGDGLVLSCGGEVGAELVNDDLGLEVPDLDSGGGGGAQPVPVGGEDKGVDDVSGLEGVKALALVEVPKHGDSVLSSGGTEGSVGGDGDGVEVAGVADEVGAELAVGQGPDLDELVPAAGNNEGDGLGGGEPNARDPLGVALVGDGELALSEGVPELHGLVAGSRDNLPVVDREGNGKDILGVANEAAGGLSRVDLPEAEGAVPGAGEGELAVGGDHDVRHEVGVALEGTAGETVVSLLAGEGPHEAGLVTGGGEDHVGVLGRGGDAGDPVFVGGEGSAEGELLRHSLLLLWVFGCGGGAGAGEELEERGMGRLGASRPHNWIKERRQHGNSSGLERGATLEANGSKDVCGEQSIIAVGRAL